MLRIAALHLPGHPPLCVPPCGGTAATACDSPQLGFGISDMPQAWGRQVPAHPKESHSPKLICLSRSALLRDGAQTTSFSPHKLAWLTLGSSRQAFGCRFHQQPQSGALHTMTFQGSPAIPAPLALDGSALPRADFKPQKVAFHRATKSHITAPWESPSC